ncbi:MAG TPA: hypothetical protein DCS82_09205 [Rhodospirillaceae bacterium]|nr:hypothetical protein [Rhodospirillaceae bacterium]HAA93311.1 hypothetical protein [Rhodospirillaceae bacterium]HAT35880.1 hypothetical protein [Rhodospirillaceae bacterium]
MKLVPEAIARRWENLPGNLRGAVWMLLMAVFFVAADSIIKIVSRRLDPIEIVFFRNIFSLLWLIPAVVQAGGLVAFHTQYPMLQFARGALGGIAMVCIFYSLQLLPLADATAVMFSRTIWMIPCAVFLLGEAIRWRRWTATVIGFIGVVIMVRPAGGIEPGMLFALANAIMAAVIFTLIKILKSKGESNLTILLWHASITIAITAVPTYYLWITPTLEEFLLLVALGLLVTIAHTCLIQALAAGEATAVTPFEYSRVLIAALIGFVFFAEIPTIWTVIGTILVVASGYYIARREAQREEKSGS